MSFKFDYQKPKVIAEIGCNHMGKIEIAKELVNLAKQSGADYVKFQKVGKKQDARSISERNQFDATGPEAVLLAQPDQERNIRHLDETLSAEEVGGWKGDLVKNNP